MKKKLREKKKKMRNKKKKTGVRKRESPINAKGDVTLDSENKDATIDLIALAKKSYTLPFIGYGALAGLPIPFIGWLWVILSVQSAIKLGWSKGLVGIGLFFGTAVATRAVLALTLILSGN